MPAAALAMSSAVALAVVDQGSKAWVRGHVEVDDRGPSLGPLTTTRVEHGLGEQTNVTDASAASARTMVAAAPLGMLLGIGAGMILPGRAGVTGAISGGLITASALSNGTDMLTRHSVTDFIDLPPGRPELVANVADLGLIAGSAGILAAVVGSIAFAKRVP